MGWLKFIFGRDRNDGSYRQDRYSGNKGSSKHEHTWSKTNHKSHKEGWVGKNVTRSSSKKRK